ncbi:MAG: TerC family protein [Prevotellaceae bacterium]|jgi:tellurite resistance protein TerC|nr:TerC family protein [Prevotellaceae bacterium]
MNNHVHVGIEYWIGFISFVIIMLMLDLGVFHKKDTEVKVKPALLWSGFWISLALLFNLGIWYLVDDKSKAMEFLTAYLLEKSLSIDNLFVFILIFSFFKIEARYQHKVLFWGIFGALIMRAIFIFAGVAIISRFSWVMYIFGVFLVYTGIHMLVEKKDKSEFNPNENIVLRTFRKIMPVTDDMSRPRFFIRQAGKWVATPFFLTLLFIEASDLVFAVDSIPAVLAVSQDTFIVFTSNIFAILGLRSLYFALNGIMTLFTYLKYALAVILSFIGLKMCVNELAKELGWHFHISNGLSLTIIVGLIALSIILSVIKNRKVTAPHNKNL